MPKAYVYKITRVDDLEYIGITVNLNKRFADHSRSQRFSLGIKNIEILKECDTYEEAEDLEEYYVSLYDTFNSGLNLSINGKGNHLCSSFTTKGFKYSDESRKKMSEKAKARGISDNCLKACRSKESRRKQSAKRKGICWSPQKLTQEQIDEMMNGLKTGMHPFNDDFIANSVAKRSRHLIGKVPLNELPTPNGKKLDLIYVYAKYYSVKFNVHKNTIVGLLKNDGKRCKHHSEI